MRKRTEIGRRRLFYDHLTPCMVMMESQSAFGKSDDKGPFQKLIDKDADGKISIEEFVLVITEHLEAMKKDIGHIDWVTSIYDTFNTYDADGDGKIGYSEWEKVFKENEMADQAKSMWQEAIKNDENNDGKLSFAEFWKYINTFK